MSPGHNAGHHSSKIAKPLSLKEARVAIDTHKPSRDGAVGFVPSDFCLLGLPHQDPKIVHYLRDGGRIQMNMVADPQFGLPYGRVSRLLLIWITTQAVIQQSPIIQLGESQSDFFVNMLGVSDTGGSTGTINRYANHMNRLLHTLFTFSDQRSNERRFMNLIVAHQGPLFSTKPSKDGRRLLGQIQLDTDFFRWLVKHAVPVDLRAVRSLQSTLALDLYLFLSYRLRGLRNPLLLRWPDLLAQLGNNIKSNNSAAGRSAISLLKKRLREVIAVYPQARIRDTELGLELHQSPPPVPKRINCSAVDNTKLSTHKRVRPDHEAARGKNASATSYQRITSCAPAHNRVRSIGENTSQPLDLSRFSQDELVSQIIKAIS